MAPPISPSRGGHIVALEGSPELVSTQLRLLPTSKQILVLPSLQQYLLDTSPDAHFDARDLIRRYHIAAQARHTQAQEFLRSSTAPGRRGLVFLHGGTMSAQVACLSTIMEHETAGDIEKAHATFIRLASNGVAGLSEPTTSRSHSSASESESTEACDDPEPASSSEAEQDDQDVWEKYLDTAEVDAIEDPIIRAMRAADALDKQTEFLQPLTPTVDLTVKLVDIPSRAKSKRRTSPTTKPSPEALYGLEGPSPVTQAADVELSAQPGHPDPSATHAISESASPSVRRPPLRLRIPSSASQTSNHKSVRTTKSSPSLRHKARSDGSTPGDTFSVSNTAWPDTVLIEQDEAQSLIEQAKAQSAGVVVEPLPAETLEEPHSAVLPLLEDFVFLFTPQTPDELHDFVFRRLSEACQTTRRSVSEAGLPATEANDNAEGGHSAVGENQEEDNELSGNGKSSTEVVPWVQKDLVHGLPTPNQSPSPLERSSMAMPLPSTKLYSISVGPETAVSIQNFLRSFLGDRFPLPDRRHSDNTGFSAQGGLWKPLECGGEVVASTGKSRLDLMLAVGAETGVKKKRLSEIVGQLEKLGFKTSALSRSGRLDIRYLIANAMQAFTAQPLTKQTQSNPFADRTLLAALIIPHLEAYLAAHPDVRFLLLEYPPDHLPTILALQALIGTEMMKVVGIINSEASSPAQSELGPDPNRRPSEGFRSLNRRGSRMSGVFVGPCSFSKANFLLASSATGFETAAFVAAIRESLISISDFYIPDRPLYKPPAPPSPPRKVYPALQVDAKEEDSKLSPASKIEQSRVSVSTLVITPPSSPTEASPPASQANPQSLQPGPDGTASHAAPVRTSRGSQHPERKSSISWGQINYAPAPPSASDTRARTGSAGSNSSSIGNNNRNTHISSNQELTTTPSTPPRTRSRHQKKDSEPLSPCGRRSASASAAAAAMALSQAPTTAIASTTITVTAADTRGEGPGSITGHNNTGTAHTAASMQSRSAVPGNKAAEDKTVGVGNGVQGGYAAEAGEEKYEEEEEEDDDDDEWDEDARRLIPLFLRSKSEIERRRKNKAFKWLGLD